MMKIIIYIKVFFANHNPELKHFVYLVLRRFAEERHELHRYS